MAYHKQVSKREIRIVACVFGGTCIALWLLYGVPLQNLNWDPSFYYAHVRSPIIDGDIDFTNDGLPSILTTPRTQTGLAPSIWSAGPSLVWTPFFLLGHAITEIGRLFGFPLVADGYGPFYLMFCAVGSVVAGWIGIIMCYLIARRIAGTGPALVAALTAGLASPLFYYMYKNPMMAHAPTVAVISGVIYVWLRISDDLDTPYLYFALGLLIGIAALMRWQNGLFALIVPFTFGTNRLRKDQVPGVVQRLGLAALGAVLGFMPQMIVWWRLYGSPLTLPQGSGFLQWSRPELLLLLFGSNRGLFVWQPFALISFIGMLGYTQRYHRLGLALFLITMLETYLNSVVQDWWGGGGFGPRRFDWFVPIQALCVALLVQRLWSKLAWRALITTVSVCCILYQLALAQGHYYRVLPDNQPFPIEEYDQGRPLPSSFTKQVIFGVLSEPSFLVLVKPAIWATAVPPYMEVSKLIQGTNSGMQLVATTIATTLLIVIICLTYITSIRVHKSGNTEDQQLRFAKQSSLLISICLLITCVVFIGTGP